MKEPSVSQAYAMIRLLKKRALKGDGEKIAELEQLIAASRDKAAAIDLDRFFGRDPALETDAVALGDQLANARKKK